MSSPFSAIVKIDPYYQKFLKSQFEWDDNKNRLLFPDRHDFNLFIEMLIMKTPHDYTRDMEDYGEHTFRIGVPNMEHKKAEFYNYLSEKRKTLFARRVVGYYEMILHQKFADWRKQCIRHDDKLIIKEFIEFIIEEFNFDFDDFDRIRKDLDRFRHNEASLKYLKKKKNG